VRRFLVDNQLPAALARWIEARGGAATHVLDLQLAQARDEIIWERAARDGAALVSKDEDFARLTLLRPEPVAVVSPRIFRRGLPVTCYECLVVPEVNPRS